MPSDNGGPRTNRRTQLSTHRVSYRKGHLSPWPSKSTSNTATSCLSRGRLLHRHRDPAGLGDAYVDLADDTGVDSDPSCFDQVEQRRVGEAAANPPLVPAD